MIFLSDRLSSSFVQKSTQVQYIKGYNEIEKK